MHNNASAPDGKSAQTSRQRGQERHSTRAELFSRSGLHHRLAAEFAGDDAGLSGQRGFGQVAPRSNLDEIVLSQIQQQVENTASTLKENQQDLAQMM